MEPIVILLGTLTGAATETPYPFIQQPMSRTSKSPRTAFGGNQFLYTTAFTFNKSEGTIQFPLALGSLSVQAAYAVCDPALAVVYEQDGNLQPNQQYPPDVVIIENDVIYRVSVPGLSGIYANMNPA